MASRTLADLRTNARRIADAEDDGEFVSDAELSRYVNNGIHALYDLRIDADNAKLFAINGPQMPSAGTFSWTLPVDFKRLVSLHIYADGDYHAAKPADVSEYAELAAEEPQATEARYFLREEFGTGTTELYIFPSGLSANDIGYVYIKGPSELSLDTDAFHGTLDALEYIEVCAAIYMLDKEESDAAHLVARKEAIAARIRNATKDVDLGAPRTVRRTRGRH